MEHTGIKKLREVAPKWHQKCFLFCHQYNVAFQTLNPALILTVFGTSDLNWCAGVYTCEKFPNFCIGVLQAPKKLPNNNNNDRLTAFDPGQPG